MKKTYKNVVNLLSRLHKKEASFKDAYCKWFFMWCVAWFIFDVVLLCKGMTNIGIIVGVVIQFLGMVVGLKAYYVDKPV